MWEFHGNDARLYDIDDDYNDSDDKKFDFIKFHADAVGLDDVDCDFYHHHDGRDAFNARNVHVVAVESGICYDYFYG